MYLTLRARNAIARSERKKRMSLRYWASDALVAAVKPIVPPPPPPKPEPQRYISNRVVRDALEPYNDPNAFAELQLVTSVLERSVADALGQTGLTEGHAEAIRAGRVYIMRSKLDDFTPFSFAWVCQCLDIDPIEVRRNLWLAIRRNLKVARSGRGNMRSTINLNFYSAQDAIN
jgi:hypothetical protein